MGLTDSQIFGKDDDARIVERGRSRINENLVKRLLQEKRYTYVQIARHPQVNCTSRHVKRARRRTHRHLHQIHTRINSFD